MENVKHIKGITVNKIIFVENFLKIFLDDILQ